MENNMAVRGRTAPVVHRQPQVSDVETDRYYPAYDEERTGKLMDEVIAAVKDDRMSRAADSTAYECASSREFQHEQLDHCHKLPWKILLFVATLVVGGVGGAALVRAAA